MEKIGTFKIETSFNITGRGIVAVCQHIDGKAKINFGISIRLTECPLVSPI